MTAPKKLNRAPADGEEKVTLLKEHTHDRVKYEAGDTITVSAATAEWLREQGVVAKTESAETPKE